MKKLLRTLSIMTLIIILMSCGKFSDFPNINFIGGDGIISKSSIMKPNEIFKVGINAYSPSDYDIWKFKVTRNHNNDSEIVLDSVVDNKNFNTIISLPSSDKNNDTERWVFSVTCYDGYTSEISLSIKTNDSITENNDRCLSKDYVIDDIPYKMENDISIYIGLFTIILISIFIYYTQRKKRIVKEYVKIEDIKGFKEEIIDKIKNLSSNKDDVLNKINEQSNKIEDLFKKISDNSTTTKNNNPFKKTSVILLISILVFLTYVIAILASVFVI